MRLPQQLHRKLTPRQRNVISLVVRGYSAQQISDRLQLSPLWVRVIVRQVRDRLRIDKSRNAAVAITRIALGVERAK